MRGDGLDNLFSSFGRRARRRHRPAQVALPVHAERRPRLGLGGGHDPRRSHVARPAAQAAAARRSQRRCSTCSIATTGEFLQATPFVYQNWNKGFDANGRPIVVPGCEFEPGRQLPRLPDARRRHQLPAAVLQPGRRAASTSSTPKSGQQYVSGPAEYERGQQYIGRGAGRGAPPARGPNEPPPSSGIKALDPEDRARRCGTSRSSRGR